MLLAALVAAVAISAPVALADGDPASDYLITQPTYLSPFDGKVSAAQSSALAALLAESKKKGFPLKVAVIVTPYDLGSVPVLFGKPQRYANFLGQELFYYNKAQLLVVMPNGYGIYKAHGQTAADRAVVAALPLPKAKDGDTLVEAANRAVVALAAKHGITLVAAPASSGSSTNHDRLLIAVAVLAIGLLAVAARYARRFRRRVG